MEQSQLRKVESNGKESPGGTIQGNSSDELSADKDSDKDRAQGERDSEVQRTVLGTSLETSVSIAVSPLEFRLRKRVKLPSESDGRPSRFRNGSSDESQQSLGKSGATQPGARDSATDITSPDADEGEEPEGENLPTGDNENGSTLRDLQGTRIVQVPENSRRPVLGSSVVEPTEPPPEVAGAVSSSRSEDGVGDHKELPSSSTDQEEEDDSFSQTEPNRCSR